MYLGTLIGIRFFYEPIKNALNRVILPNQAVHPFLTSPDIKDRFYTSATEEERKFTNHVFECVGSMGEEDNKELIFKIKDCLLQDFPAGHYAEFQSFLSANYPLTLLVPRIDAYARHYFGLFNPTQEAVSFFSSFVYTDERIKWIEHVYKKLGFAILDDEGNRYYSKNVFPKIYGGELSVVNELPTSDKLRLRLPTPATLEKRWEQIKNDSAKAHKYGITESNFRKLKERISIALTSEATDSLKFVQLLNEEHHDVVADKGPFFMHDLIAHVIPTVAGIALEATGVDDDFRYTLTKVLFDEVVLDLRNRIEEEKDETIKKLLVEFLSRLVDSSSASFGNCQLLKRILLSPTAFHDFVFAETPKYIYAKEWKAMLRSMVDELSDEVFQEKWQLAVKKWTALCKQNPHVIHQQNRAEGD